MSTLARDFYNRDTVIVAKELLGKKIVRKINGEIVSGIITETEAYRFRDDPASHAYRGITPRNHAMFEQVGRAYVYFTYGMYFCFNAVARHPKYEAGAVLIRAIQPEKGLAIMKNNRKNKDEKNLTNGPAKLTQALGITKKQYGVDLTSTRSELYIANGASPKKIISDARIGINVGLDRRWNFKSA